MFEINIKEIPYFNFSKLKERNVFEYKQSSPKSESGNKEIVISDHDRTANQKFNNVNLEAMKEFLTYFLKKRIELIKRIKKLKILDKGIIPKKVSLQDI